MSKLYDIYLELKRNEDNSTKTLYLFKSGIFFIFLDNDARIASELLNLKITYLTEHIVKCGFPISSLEKYSNLLKQTSYTFKIIDVSKNTTYNINNYKLDEKINNLLNTILKVDTNNISIKEAYSFIDNIKYATQQIIEGENNNAKH